jgi:hypothetical protein
MASRLFHEGPDFWQDFLRDDPVHAGKHLTRNRKQWPPGLKAYVEDDAGLQVELRTESGYPTYFVAWIKRAVIEDEVLGPNLLTSWAPNRPRPGPARYRKGGVMLVGVPHLVKKNKMVRPKIAGSALVRLMSFQGVDESPTWVILEDRFREFVEGRAIPAYRKTHAIVPNIARNRSPHQVVKEGAEVVDEIRSDESKARWYRFMVGNLEDIAATLEIRASYGSILVPITKLEDLNIQVVKVQFRSTKPPFEVIQRFTLGGSSEATNAKDETGSRDSDSDSWRVLQ